MKLQATSLLQKGLPRKCLSVNFVNFSRIPFLKNLSRWLLLTLQVHKVDKKVSRYCKKNIKVMSTEALLVNLNQLWKWFCMVRKLSNHHSEKLTKASKILQEKYLRWSFVLVKCFFCSSVEFYLWRWSLWSYETSFGNFTFRVQYKNCNGAFSWWWSTC